jgi:hypothetical protein
VSVLILAGTRKGLFLLRGEEDRRNWKVEGPLLTGWEVYHAMLDPRDSTLYAATQSYAYGATVHRSSDLGMLREGMASDRLDPVGIYVGTQSGSVFVSPDEGEDWVEAASQLPPVLSIEVGEWR